MSPALRRCNECDYRWSRYLRFPHCPRCGSNVLDATVRYEISRTKKVGAALVILGIVISVLAEILRPFF